MAIISYLDSQDSDSRKIALTNPATNKPLYEIRCHSEDEVTSAVNRARQAQESWGALPIEKRVAYMLKLRDTILDNQDKIVQTVIGETGKPLQDALMMEVFAVCSMITYWCAQAPKTLSDHMVKAPGMMRFVKKIKLVYKPLGVVGVIAPWNGPLS